LGTSEDAAQKRVSRAVERLREFFAKRGVTIGAGGLAVALSANAVQAAPVGLAATISAALTLAGAAVSASTATAATKAIVMTTLQKTLLTATVAVLAGAGIYEARQAAQLREQAQALRQRLAPLNEQIQRLQPERDAATNRLAALLAENQQLQTNPDETELLRLRGEVTVLRRQLDDRSKQFASVPSEHASDHSLNLPDREQYNQRQETMKNGFLELAIEADNFARQNGGQMATNLEQLRPTSGWESLNASGGDIG